MENREEEFGSAKSKAILRYTIRNISQLNNDEIILSPPTYVRDIPWRIQAGIVLQNGIRMGLSFFLKCDGIGDQSRFNCKAIANLKILSSRRRGEAFTRDIQHVFNNLENDWGYRHFIQWTLLADPSKAYISNNSITLEIEMTANEPAFEMMWDIKSKERMRFSAVDQIELRSADEMGEPKWWPRKRNHPDINQSFNLVGKLSIPGVNVPLLTGVNPSLFSFGVAISYSSTEKETQLRIYEIPTASSSTAAKINLSFNKLEAIIGVLKPDGTQLFQYRIAFLMTDKCEVQTCSCHQRDMCKIIKPFCPVDLLIQGMEESDISQKSHQWKINLLIEIHLGVFTSRTEDYIQLHPIVPVPVLDKLTTMKKILNEEIESDVTLVVDGETFHCHRNMLAGHSEVFAAMFKTEMTESRSGIVEIEDMTPLGMSAFLLYLYCCETKEIENDMDITSELLRAGQKYGIESLTKLCLEIILSKPGSSFSIACALQAFAFGRLVDNKSLERKAVLILKEKGPEMGKSDAFRKFLSEHIDLAQDLFAKIAML